MKLVYRLYIIIEHVSNVFLLCLAKNVILAGVKSVTLYDSEPVQIQDLSTQVRQRLITTEHLLIQNIVLPSRG